MNTTLKTARVAMIGSVPLLMLSGMVLRNGGGDQLALVHGLLGAVLSLSLWTIAGIAARAGVPIRIVALAVSWSLVAIALGVAQEGLLTGSSHWVVQLLHVVTSVGMVVWGQGLVLLMRRHGSAGSAPRQRRQGQRPSPAAHSSRAGWPSPASDHWGVHWGRPPS